MKALTLWRPWPWSIFWGSKRIENRPWYRKSLEGKRIALHAGQKYDYDGAKAIRSLHPEMPGSADDHPIGIVDVARVVGVVESTMDSNFPDGQEQWFSGPFAWVLEDVVALPRVMKVAGMQGLWDVPKTMAEDIERYLDEWERRK